MVPHLTKTNLAGNIDSLIFLAKKEHKISLFTNFGGIRTSIRTFMNIKKFHFCIQGLLFFTQTFFIADQKSLIE